MVSPYLLRRIRSLEEIEGAKAKPHPLEAVVEHALRQARAAGKGPHDQIDHAAIALLKTYPEMSVLDALAAVQQVRKSLRASKPRER